MAVIAPHLKGVCLLNKDKRKREKKKKLGEKNLALFILLIINA